ncbi:helix-turn-helix transcriptional regulator [uncultured Tateyamaria sp.]|uniref:helix-turn-helix transcriptional regulator n=2 Tax=uncultured Tateyamaria sp. TaxID=455651 RepID=UPI002603103C|nr:helix-turn-helix transcriptional regulator [uncultured Tateyamaria sp.]
MSRLGKLLPNTTTSEDTLQVKLEENERMAREEMHRRFAPEGTIHDNLRNYRVRLGFTKQQMAEILEVTPRTYYAYEEGHRAVPTPAIAHLAILTGGDLNEIILGRPAPRSGKAARVVIDEAIVVLKFLAVKYPDMSLEDRYKVIRLHALDDLDSFPRMHPDIIRDFVKIVTRYKFHPEDLPAPPFHEDYGDDHDGWERDMAEWQRMVDEDFPEDEKDK